MLNLKRYLLLIALLAFILIFNYLNHADPLYFIRPSLNDTIPQLNYQGDLNNDGLDDLSAIVAGAQQEVSQRTKYKNAYYAGGYPPEGEGVCTDVIWRALANAGYDLKTALDSDINNYPDAYPTITTPDPNIDFRRVRNLTIFMQRHMENLTTDIVPYDVENLQNWQAGDFVIINNKHIAVVSPKRRKDGVPYVLHNAFLYAREEDRLLTWSQSEQITAHFRFVQPNN